MTTATLAPGATIAGIAPLTVTLHEVTNLSGMKIRVMGDDELAFFVQQQVAYQTEHKFTAATDLTDLDRLLFLELLVYRATMWLSSGKRYDGGDLLVSEEVDCRKVIKENNPMISAIKNDLGLTKSQRDKDQFESVGKYITDLKARAREHGIKRERELTKALCLIKELFSLVGSFDRADEIERRMLGLETSDEILEWVRDHMKPEFDRIDDYFRTHDQKFWVKSI